MSRGLDIANGLQKKSTTADIHRLRCVVVTFPTSEQEGIHPESGHSCECHISFSRSLFRPGRNREGRNTRGSQDPPLYCVYNVRTVMCSSCAYKGAVGMPATGANNGPE